jgi:glycosyltransferase involved in cell wall biosynthesis
VRILLASPGLAIGGAERVVLALAEGLTARGHIVAVSGAAGPLDAELAPAVRRLTLPDRGRSPAGMIEWTVRQGAFVRDFRPHVVHAHNARATLAAAAAIRLGRGPRRPGLIGTHHGATADDRATARIIERAADLATCVSEDLLPCFTRAVSVVHNGVAPAAPAPGHDGLLVAAVGRLVPAKAPERFLAAAKLIHIAEPRARFLVVGDGPLRARIEQLGRGLPVEFAGARADARALIAGADVLVVASDAEGHSIVTLEALAAGVPVVSTPVAGMRSVLGGGAGRIVGEFSAEALAAATLELLRDPEVRTEMGRTGAALVAERFSADAMVTAYETHYRRVTSLPNAAQ